MDERWRTRRTGEETSKVDKTDYLIRYNKFFESVRKSERFLLKSVQQQQSVLVNVLNDPSLK